MVQCSECETEIEESSAIKVNIDGREHYFHIHHVRHTSLTEDSTIRNTKKLYTIPRQILVATIFNKTFAEVIAIGAGLGGILYTMRDLTLRALFLDTTSFTAAIFALLMGIGHIQFLRRKFLLTRIIILVAIVVMIIIALVVWQFVSS